MSEENKISYDPKVANAIVRFMRNCATDSLNVIPNIEAMHSIIVAQAKEIDALKKKVEELQPKKKAK